MHLLNASASQIHRLACSGHSFQVIALDGNPVPTPQRVDLIEIAPGERVDAIVEMNNPGVWILGVDAQYGATIRHGDRGGVRQSAAARTTACAAEGAVGLHDLWQERAASGSGPDDRPRTVVISLPATRGPSASVS